MIKQSKHKLSLQVTKHDKDMEVRTDVPCGHARCETLETSESILTHIAKDYRSDFSQTTIDSIAGILFKSIIISALISNVKFLIYDIANSLHQYYEY